MRWIVVIFIILFLFQCNSCFGDNIHLKNGNVVEGTVIKEDKNMFFIEIEGGTVSFHKNEIASIEKQGTNDTIELFYRVIDMEKSESPLKIMLTTSIVVSTNVKENILRHYCPIIT